MQPSIQTKRQCREEVSWLGLPSGSQLITLVQVDCHWRLPSCSQLPVISLVPSGTQITDSSEGSSK